MKVVLLSLFAAVALGVDFTSDASCNTYVTACGGTAGDAATCEGQDALVTAAMVASGMDVTDPAYVPDATTFPHMVRLAYYYNWENNGVMQPHIDYEPILRCNAEQAGLTYTTFSTCFSEWGDCMSDAACVAAWDGVANNTKAATTALLGRPTAFTYVSGGMQAIGGALVPFTLGQDPTTPMTATDLGLMVGYADMADNGKVMAMMSCMLNDWAGADIGASYPTPCFDLGVACAADADCVQASVDVAECADDKFDIAMTPVLPFWPTIIGSMPTGSSHDDWCSVAECCGEVGNSLFMSLATCSMNTADNGAPFQYKKCYDDMMAKLVMMFVLIGGVSFVVGVLLFTGAWCMCCKGSKQQANGVEP